MDSSSKFSYILCPGSQPDPRYRTNYQKIYDCWRDVWSEAFDELGVHKPFYSDPFSRQDYVGALFHEGTCIAMSFFRWLDARTPGFEQDSYFSNWAPKHLEQLRSRGDQIIICSFFTVHPEVRRKQLGISVKDLMCGLLVETFLNSKAHSMTGAVRINKGVNHLVERWGACPIDQNIPTEYGADVDLVGFFKDHISRQPAHELKGLAEAVWHSRQVIPKLHAQDDLIETNIIPIKKAA